MTASGVLPYYHVPVFEIGPIPIDPWATLVCIGFLVGMEVARARAIRLGLDVRDVVDGLVFTVGSGFVVGHLVHVLAYHPERLREEGLITLLRVWGGFSSMGGFLGAVVGSVVFYRLIRKRPFWLHADTIAYGFPFGWTLGRTGCALVHDHIGKPSRFFLAVDFPELGPRHDLGLYEALYTLGVAILFWRLGRRNRTPGFFTATWCLLYAPARFLLDFLRSTDLDFSDRRYAGLTPAQYGCILLFLAGLGLAWHVRRTADKPPNPDTGASPGAGDR